MKLLSKMKLHSKILITFLAAVFFLSIGHIFVYSHLLNTIENELHATNTESLNSAVIKMETVFSNIQHRYSELTQTSVQWGSEIGEYTLSVIYHDTSEVFEDLEHVSKWVLFLDNCDSVVSDGGVYSQADYLSAYCYNEVFDLDFYLANMHEHFFIKFLPESNFSGRSASGQVIDNTLMPIMLKSYWNSNMMVVLFLDLQSLCENTDSYLLDGMYIFSENGTLLSSSDPDPVITEIPAEKEFIALDKTEYVLQQKEAQHGLQYVKILPESIIANHLQSSVILCACMALSSLAIALLLILTSIKRLTAPVDRMLLLLKSQSSNSSSSAYDTLKQILNHREKQAALLAERDAALSEYFLQSRLKNIYVDMDSQRQEPDGPVFVIYIQVQYRKSIDETFCVSQAEVEKCLQEMMSQILSSLFQSTLMSQLESGCFVARVTASQAEKSVEKQIHTFMRRLEQEREFANFTVVLSQSLQPQDDMALVYNQVLEAAHQAIVSDESQLLTLPLATPATEFSFIFSQQDEQALSAYIKRGETENAITLIKQILDTNFQKRINHTQAEILCTALVNTVASAASDAFSRSVKIAAVSHTLNSLITSCHTASAYQTAVIDFTRSIAVCNETATDKDSLLQKIQQYLQNNYQHDFSIEEMADALNLSRSYLSSYYKNKTGTKLNDSIQIYRIQKATELLQNPAIKISEVGPSIGINNPGTLIRLFKKYTGMTPKDYQQTALWQTVESGFQKDTT